MRPLVHSGVPRWAFVTGLAALIVLLSLNQLRQAPSVQAATLLRRAVAVSQTQPRAVHRIRVRSSRQPEFTRVAGAHAARRRSGADAGDCRAVPGRPLGLERSSERPRLPSSGATNKFTRPTKLTAVEDPRAPSEHLTRIRTVSADGELEAASITLDTDDYAPVERAAGVSRSGMG